MPGVFVNFFYLRLLLEIKTRAQSWRYRGVPLKNLSTRTYRPGDERQIRALFHLTFRKYKPLTRWRWEFLENPVGKVDIVVLESEKAGIVGHYGGIVVGFYVSGAVIPVAQIADVMIHAAFRGRASLSQLVHAFIENSRGQGMKLLYGFNGDAVARSNRRFFGAEVTPVSDWVKELSPSARPLCAGDLPVVTQVHELDAQIDSLWERIKDGCRCAVARDKRYLDWRYSRNSDRAYTLWRATDASGQIVGACVLSTNEDDGLILELLADVGDVKVVTALLRTACLHFSQTGRNRVRAWFSVHGKLRECAQAEGFHAIDSRLNLNLFRLDDSLSGVALKEEFYYSLGDYDVY